MVDFAYLLGRQEDAAERDRIAGRRLEREQFERQLREEESERRRVEEENRQAEERAREEEAREKAAREEEARIMECPLLDALLPRPGGEPEAEELSCSCCPNWNDKVGEIRCQFWWTNKIVAAVCMCGGFFMGFILYPTWRGPPGQDDPALDDPALDPALDRPLALPGISWAINFNDLEKQIPAAARSLDAVQCGIILDSWNYTANVLYEIRSNAKLPPPVSKAALHLREKEVLPGLETWKKVLRCAEQKLHLHPDPKTDEDCRAVVMTFLATSFRKRVQATSTQLCSSTSQLFLPDCPNGIHTESVLATRLDSALHVKPEEAFAFDLAQTDDLEDELDSNMSRTRKLIRRMAQHCGNVATSRHAIDHFVNSGNRLENVERYGLAGAEAAVVWGAAQYGGEVVSTVAAASCAGVLIFCVTVAAAVMSVASLAFMGLVLTGKVATPLPTDSPGALSTMNKALEEIDQCEHLVGSEMSDLAFYADLFNGGNNEASKRSIEITVQSVQKSLNCVLNDMVEVAVKADELKIVDDDRINTYNSCWFIMCGYKPVRIVPEHISHLTAAMKTEFRFYQNYVGQIATCCQQPDNLCSSEVVGDLVHKAQYRFQMVDGDWRLYKQTMCSYHDWTVCSTRAVLAAHRELHNKHVRQHQPFEHAPFIASAGVCAALVALLLWKMTRSLVKMSASSAKQHGLEPLLA